VYEHEHPRRLSPPGPRKGRAESILGRPSACLCVLDLRLGWRRMTVVPADLIRPVRTTGGRTAIAARPAMTASRVTSTWRVARRCRTAWQRSSAHSSSAAPSSGDRRSSSMFLGVLSVYRRPRNFSGSGGSPLSWPAGRPHQHSHRSGGTFTVEAKGTTDSWRLAHQYRTTTRGAKTA
jgi:hypothetical protein